MNKMTTKTNGEDEMKNSEPDNSRPSRKALRQAWKKNARFALKKNYIACIAVCFIMVFIGGEYSTTTQAVSTYDNTNVADLKYTTEQKQEIIEDMIAHNKTPEQTSEEWKVGNVTAVNKWLEAYQKHGVEGLNSKEVTFFGSTQDNSNLMDLMDTFSITKTAKERLEMLVDKTANKASAAAISYFDGLTKNNTYQFKFMTTIFSVLSKAKTWDIIVNLCYFLFSLLFTIFITNFLMVCERRFFLENRTYHKTKIGRLGFLFRERTLHPAKTMFVKDIYFTLWSLTIVGFFIKGFSYSQVPFILAENPNIKTNKAITLSRKMMDGHKMELFILDLTMIGWVILSMMTLGLFGILFSNPYRTAVHAEFYIKLRREAIEKNIEGSEFLNDKYLDLDLLQKQLEDDARSRGENPDIVMYKPVFTVSVAENADDKVDYQGGEEQ